MAKFEVGMIVRLKRGGHLMTIVELGGRDDAGEVTVALCVWIDEQRVRRQDAFDLRYLEEIGRPAGT